MGRAAIDPPSVRLRALPVSWGCERPNDAPRRQTIGDAKPRNWSRIVTGFAVRLVNSRRD
jgi:hypothetical protein